MSKGKCELYTKISVTIHEYVSNLTLEEGIAEGLIVGMTLGSALGIALGVVVGSTDGIREGVVLGWSLGFIDSVGVIDGIDDGSGITATLAIGPISSSFPEVMVEVKPLGSSFMD